ncbi:hypothetical protein [Paraburkholderia kururiensis]|uniref:hypothetical protein n=2 Tax=Paraburkholderia TaxID=1822464 RepID=UPI003B7F44AE
MNVPARRHVARRSSIGGHRGVASASSTLRHLSVPVMSEIYPFKRATRFLHEPNRRVALPAATEQLSHDNAMVLAEIEDCCAALFDRWCETRHVVPLAYLMHVWPLPGTSVDLARRVAIVLRELQRLHTESLGPVEHQLIRRALGAVERAFPS